MKLYPLLMNPYYRFGEETPWGGSVLREVFGKDAPEARTGESLEVSALPGQESTVGNGECAGMALSKVAELWGEALTGTSDGSFPLLLKLLDAQQTLSVQVHPGDEYALAHDKKRGKSEAWVVLNAEPGAQIVAGLELNGENLADVIAEGRVEAVLRRETVRPGDVIYIPAGMVHALGGGIQVYEIQQSSDATYRLWDWGSNRELHTQKALDVCKADQSLSKIGGATVLCAGGSRTYYVSDEHFELCRLNLSGKMPLSTGRMLFLTPIAPCVLHWGEEALVLDAFDSVVVPAQLEGAWLEGNSKVLLSSLPNRDALKAELGYRAENVAGLME
jgi:mannose-6-phosphate isomerase